MRKELLDGEDIFVLHDFFSPEECDAAIAVAESAGFEEAPITTASGPVMARDMRDNARAMIDDTDTAVRLYERARPMLPARLREWDLVGFNERWRYYRYDPGEKFSPHFDGYFARNAGERSHLTFMIYLNDDFAGGETNFFFLSTDAASLSVRPVKGMALVFVHRKLHEGAPVLRGRKYVQRTDIMYRRTESQHAS